MKEFLYWEQIQERLSQRVQDGKEPYSFYDAARELWKEGAAHTAEHLPMVSFADWDAVDLDEFEEIYNRVPIDMSVFNLNFKQDRPAAKAAEVVITLDVIPLRIAWDQATGMHRHGFFEIDYVMRGDAALETDECRHELHAGDFCFVAPGLHHDILPERGAQVISITIASITLEQTLYRLLRRENILASFFHAALDNHKTGYLLITVPQERRIREMIRGILHEYFAHEEYASDIMPDHLAILFAFILRRCGDNYERHSEDEEWLGAPPMLSILKYIQTHYQTTSLGEVAELFHYEPSYLGKQIKAATGKNYTDMILEMRISEAKRLLRATELSVDEVAEAVGYTGRVHFFRSFRKVVGTTPGEYRSKHRKGTN